MPQHVLLYRKRRVLLKLPQLLPPVLLLQLQLLLEKPASWMKKSWLR
jgi:hypothetical protein